MACIKLYSLWQEMTILICTTNMRIQLFSNNSTGNFSKQLLTLGDGTALSYAAGETTISHVGTTVDSVDDLTTIDFPDQHIKY